MKRIYCKIFGHDGEADEVVYGYNPMKPAPAKYAEDYQIRSRWHCKRCGYREDNLPMPGEPWVTVQAASNRKH